MSDEDSRCDRRKPDLQKNTNDSSSLSSDEEESRRRRKKRRRRQHEKRKRRRRSRDNYSSDDSSCSSSSSASHHRKKHHKKKKKKKKHSRNKRSRKEPRYDSDPPAGIETEDVKISESSVIADHPSTQKGKANNNTSVANYGTAEKNQEQDQQKLEAARRMVPMSKEQYDKEQSKIREVFDEESGRYRLVRGSGEIIERIVSRDDHQRINQTATRGDGLSFSKHVFSATRKF